MGRSSLIKLYLLRLCSTILSSCIYYFMFSHLPPLIPLEVTCCAKLRDLPLSIDLTYFIYVQLSKKGANKYV